MSQADELLEQMTSDSVSTYTANPETEPHIVIGDDRVVKVPAELKRIAVQFDHDVETVTFDCPRYWDDLDMSQMRIYINYMRKDRVYGCFAAENITVDEANDRIMHFNWTISRNVTMVEGPLIFLVCIRKANEDEEEVNHWNSELNEEMYVSKGLECAEIVLDPYPDILAQWEEDVEEVKDILLAARDAGELDGATFTPVLTKGDKSVLISWTNDRERENPEPVEIRGDDGVSPVVEVTEFAGGHTVKITDVDGEKSFDVLNGGTDAINQYMENYVVIGDTEPTAGPALWLDTSKAGTE